MDKLKDWKYKMIEQIGEGRLSKVYQCRDKENRRDVAIKIVPFLSDYEGVDCTTVREVSLLKEMDHDNVVKLLDIKSSRRNVYLVFEYLETDLEDLMVSDPQYFRDSVRRKKYLQQILRGVEYCHSRNILHRDLKPSNLLIDIEEEIVKLADFGLGRSIEVPSENYTTGVGTLTYKAPELLLGLSKYSTPIDIWSVGCIFAKMVKQMHLFPPIDTNMRGGQGFIHQLRAIFSVMGTPNDGTWPGISSFCFNIHNFPQYKPKNLALEFNDLEPDGVDLLSRMLELDPTKRITARDALEHRYFAADVSLP